MTDLSQGASELDARLAEIDRKLRAIQVDLDPEREPRPSRPSPVAQKPAQGPPDPPLDPTPAPPREPAREQRSAGRSGPLAALLQRASSRSAAPESAQPGSAQPQSAHPESAAPESAPPRASAPEHAAPGAMLPAEMHAKLVSAMRDLLDAYGWTLQQLPVAPAPQPAGGDPPPVAMSVGPFANTAAVRAFEQELLRLPGVREVTLRGYEGENRAMFDVQLAAPNA